jgi:hypothetical protein
MRYTAQSNRARRAKPDAPSWTSALPVPRVTWPPPGLSSTGSAPLARLGQRRPAGPGVAPARSTAARPCSDRLPGPGVPVNNRAVNTATASKNGRL